MTLCKKMVDARFIIPSRPNAKQPQGYHYSDKQINLFSDQEFRIEDSI